MRTASVTAAMIGTSPETALLLCGARTALEAEHVARISTLLRANLDWPALLQTAQWHGVLPLLARSLATVGQDAVPPAVWAQLQEDVDANTWHNRLCTSELVRLLHLLDAHGIPALPYKGPVLAAAVYGDLALRQFGDLDIVVPRQEVVRARDLLLGQGYQPPVPMTYAQEAAHLRAWYNVKLVRADIGLLVELHWAITPQMGAFPLDFAALWHRRQPVAIAGATVAHCHPADMLMLLCVHGAKDRWRRLIWICDIAELVRGQPGLEWAQVLAQARAQGGVRRLWLGLGLAHALLGTALPPTIVHQMQAEPVIPSLVAQVQASVYHAMDSQPRDVASDAVHTFALRVRERWGDRLQYLLHYVSRKMMPNAKDRAFLPQPAQLAGLAWLGRPIRLGWEYGLGVLSLVKHFGHDVLLPTVWVSGRPAPHSSRKGALVQPPQAKRTCPGRGLVGQDYDER